jgi:methyltransferase, FkbM family
MNMGASADHPDTSGERVVIENLPRSPIILDVGANVGEYASMVLETRPDARLWCFEPSAVAHAELSKRLAGKVVLLPFGLGDTEEEVELFGPSAGSPLGSAYRRAHATIEFNPNERVQFRRLDDVCDEMAITKIDLLKLDVEGHELAVLKGAENAIRSGAVDVIQFEFGGSNIDSRTFLRDFFALLGPSFIINRVVRDGLMPVKYHERMEVFSTTNYVAIRRLAAATSSG